MKLVVIPNNFNLEKYIKVGANAFIFGLENYSVGFTRYINLEELSVIKNKYNTEIFVSLNKNMFNEDLKELEEILIKLDKIGVAGVLFYDVAILSTRNRLNLTLDLVWNQTHMATNYNTCNYFYNKNVKYGILSSEITLEDINGISCNTKMKLFVNLVGYQTMGFSRRTLLTNYFKSINKDKKLNKYKIINNGVGYYIIEEKDGTNLINGKILNGVKYIEQLNTDYGIFIEEGLDEDTFIRVLDYSSKYIKNNDNKYIIKIDNLIGKYRGFFNNKTIYKVKK